MSSVAYDGGGGTGGTGGITGGGTNGGTSGVSGNSTQTGTFDIASSSDGIDYAVTVSGHTYTLQITDGMGAVGAVTLGDPSSLQYTGGADKLDSVYGSINDISNPFTQKVVTDADNLGKVEFGGDYDTKTENIYEVKTGYTDAYYQFNEALSEVKSEYKRNERLSRLGSNESDYWDFSIDWSGLISSGLCMLDSDCRGGVDEYVPDYEARLRAQLAYVQLNTTNQMGAWMAGGDLYDAPRAGDFHFNVTGNMNTTTFLGLGNNNIDLMFQAREGLMADVHKILPIKAGLNMEDDNGINVHKIIHNAKIRRSIDELNLDTQGSMDTGSYSTQSSVTDHGVNSLGDVWDDAKDLFDSGCFITTATLKAIKTQDDNCYILELFRAFRDNWLKKQKGGDKIIARYYIEAPLIVEAIGTNVEIYEQIWNRYLMPFQEAIEDCQNYKAFKIYYKMVCNLRKKYLYKNNKWSKNLYTNANILSYDCDIEKS